MKPLQILGKKVPFVVKKGFANEDGTLGEYLPGKYKILIDAELKGTELTWVIIHEMIHAMFDRGGLLDAQIPPEVEEVIATQVAIVITENFKLQRK